MFPLKLIKTARILRHQNVTLKPFNRLNRYSLPLSNKYNDFNKDFREKISRNVELKIDDFKITFNKYYKNYQDFVGITAVLEAQNAVNELTDQLHEVQVRRRQLHREVETTHQQLLETHERITKSELYSENHYSLFERARQLSSTLKQSQNDFGVTEDEERLLFTKLTASIKFCHEKERTYSENSKYWSILISVISASVAALVTSLNNWIRIRSINDHSSELNSNVLNKLKELSSSLLQLETNFETLKTKNESPGYVDNIYKGIQSLQANFKDLNSRVSQIDQPPIGGYLVKTENISPTDDSNLTLGIGIKSVLFLAVIAFGYLVFPR